MRIDQAHRDTNLVLNYLTGSSEGRALERSHTSQKLLTVFTQPPKEAQGSVAFDSVEYEHRCDQRANTAPIDGVELRMLLGGWQSFCVANKHQDGNERIRSHIIRLECPDRVSIARFIRRFSRHDFRDTGTPQEFFGSGMICGLDELDCCIMQRTMTTEGLLGVGIARAVQNLASFPHPRTHVKHKAPHSVPQHPHKTAPARQRGRVERKDDGPNNGCNFLLTRCKN